MSVGKVRIKSAILASFIALASIIHFSCGGNGEEKKPNRLSFNIDSALIAPEADIEGYKVSFNPPAGLARSEEFLKKLNSGVEISNREQKEIFTRPVDVFVDSSFNIVVVSAVESAVKDSAAGGLAKVTGAIKKQFSAEKMKFAEFLKDDIRISQFLIQDSVNVIFKLLLENPDKKIMQFDYIIPQRNYRNEIKAIESSIGSIKYKK
jgi:hypothetical protein